MTYNYIINSSLPDLATVSESGTYEPNSEQQVINLSYTILNENTAEFRGWTVTGATGCEVERAHIDNNQLILEPYMSGDIVVIANFVPKYNLVYISEGHGTIDGVPTYTFSDATQYLETNCTPDNAYSLAYLKLEIGSNCTIINGNIVKIPANTVGNVRVTSVFKTITDPGYVWADNSITALIDGTPYKVALLPENLTANKKWDDNIIPTRVGCSVGGEGNSALALSVLGQRENTIWNVLLEHRDLEIDWFIPSMHELMEIKNNCDNSNTVSRWFDSANKFIYTSTECTNEKKCQVWLGGDAEVSSIQRQLEIEKNTTISGHQPIVVIASAI